jgi:hypothetical protein
MTQGCLIFAHDGTIDYGSQAVLAARLVIKHLGMPVSLVTDKDTIKNINKNFKKTPFDQIIEIPAPESKNTRLLTDHAAIVSNLAARLAIEQYGLPADQLPMKPVKEVVSFINDSRVLAYDLTPYDRTLVIDSDYLIFSDHLNRYWDWAQDFLICPGMLYIQENNIGPKDFQINPYTINQLWATTFMFSKTADTKIFFNLLKYIQEEYEYFAALYNFDPGQYRNDFAFSVACHIIGGHGVDKWHGELPIPLMLTDADRIVDIKSTGEIVFLLGDTAQHGDYLLSKSYQQDIHLMNKRDILANLDKLMELAE